MQTTSVEQLGGLSSLALRGVSVGAKFLLLVAMARYFAFDDIGRYGIMVATVGILSRLAGLEFYTVSSRQLVDADRHDRWRIVNGHAVVLAAGLAVACVACVVVTRTMDVGVGGLILAGILVSHQVSMEASRILVAVSKPVWSYAVGAVANGLWPLVIIALWWIFPATAVLTSVWLAWLVGAFAGAALGCALVVRAFGTAWHSGTPGDGWSQRGLRTAALFLVTALALRAIEFADRFVVQAFLGSAALGVYTYYAGFAKLVIELPTVLVVSPQFPRIITAMGSGFREHARSILRALGFKCLLLSGLAVIPLFTGMWGLSIATGRPELWSHVPAYAVLLIGNVLMAGSLAGHYALYGAGHDRAIAGIAVSGAVANVIISVALTPVLGLAGAAAGTMTAMAWIGVGNTLYGGMALNNLPLESTTRQA